MNIDINSNLASVRGAQPQIELRQQTFRPGMKVRAVHFATGNSSLDDNLSVPPGTIGEVVYVDTMGTVHVRWENGSGLGVLLEDRLEIVSPPDNLF